MEKIKNLLATSTFRNSSITLIATIINGFLGAIFFILSARYLGPSDYGLFVVGMTVLTLVASICTFGTDTGIVNFVSRYITDDKIKAYRFLKLALKVKIAVGLFVSITGILTASVIASIVFGKPELNLILKIAFLGVSAQLLFGFGTSALQSLQSFWKWGIVNIGQNAVRVILLFLLFWATNISTQNVMLLYALIPFVGFFMAIQLLPKKFLVVKHENSVSAEFFKYNIWVALFSAIAALSSRLDTFITARLLDNTQVGIYGAANQLVLIIPQLIAALGTVIAPKMAEQSNLEEFVKYLKKTQLLVIGLSVLGLLSIPFVLWLIPYLFGNSFVASGPLFVILLIAMLVFLISVPIHMAVIYYYSFPKLFFFVALGHLAIIGGVGWYLVRYYGAMGAAVTVLIGTLFNFAIPTLWVLNKIRKHE